MPILAAPVAIWAAGAATAVGFAGAATAIGAVAGAVAVGIVSGALVGAASAAISGGDIFKGALKGAIVGGITGGVLSGAGMLTGVADATTQLAKFGVEQGASGALQSISAAAPTVGIETPMAYTEEAGKGILSSAPSVAQQGAQGIAQETGKSLISNETAKVLSGVGQGIAQGYGESEAAKTKAESDKEIARFTEQQKIARIDANSPGSFDSRTANIKIPDWWNKYLNPQLNNQGTGILATGGA